MVVMLDRVDGVAPVFRAEDVDRDSGELENKLKLIYSRFKLINGIQSSDQNTLHSFSQSGVSLLSAYCGYIQLMKNCKALFSHSAMFTVMPDATTNEVVPASRSHLEFIEKIRLLFPTAFKNLLSTLDVMTVPEMVDKLRRDVQRDWYFITSGLEIVYLCAQAVDRRDEWQSLDKTTEFTDYLNDMYAMIKVTSEFYSYELKNRVPGEFPAISDLPGVAVAIKLIISNGHHHQALVDLVNSWGS